jgi:CBS domain-containing protein
MWWPAIGGLFVGVGGLFAPRALGVGYDVIRDLFAGNLVAGAALGLLVAKSLMWAVALGSGTSGGVLAPLLIMGGAMGALESAFIPGHDPGLWAIISMAAMMGGTMRSPLTAVIFLLELTHDINLLGGLLLACVAAHAVTVLVMKRSILTEKVARRGHHVMREYSVNPLAQFRVEDVMHPPGETSQSMQDTLDADGELLGVTYPDELLDEAMTKMILTGIRELPIVERETPGLVIGYVDTDAIATAWRELHDEEHVRERGAVS